MGSRSFGGIACVMRNLAMWTVVPLMYVLKLSHMDILSHTLMLLSEMSGDLILAVFQAKNEIRLNLILYEWEYYFLSWDTYVKWEIYYKCVEVEWRV